MSSPGVPREPHCRNEKATLGTSALEAGYVIECPNCGVVYRSRQYWFGNQDPVNTVVRTEIVHTDGFLKDNNNAAQRLLDGMNFMAQSVSELSLGPTKAVTSWLTDQIAPAYWRPNSQILFLVAAALVDFSAEQTRAITYLPLCFVLDLEQSCYKCAMSFKDNDTKHHCRACGEGVCDSCSSKTRPVPERGWGPVPVRVCDNCYEARNVQLEPFCLEEGYKGAQQVADKGLTDVIGFQGLGRPDPQRRPLQWLPDSTVVFGFRIQKYVTEAQVDDEGGTLIARKVGEAVQNTLGAVVTAIDIPLGGPGSASLGTVLGSEAEHSLQAVLTKCSHPERPQQLGVYRGCGDFARSPQHGVRWQRQQVFLTEASQAHGHHRKELWFHLKSPDISDCRDWKEPVVLKPYHRGGFDLQWPNMENEAEFVTELLGGLSCREVHGRSFLVRVSV
ncbi:Zinc finger FYVE domain-containing protein 1 [Saguinus oedipus]|uniref:Zinc finger FYVE domain-containing protein 1 n=1 Tax=Saguinus oedipus TaxID=9490 RepID=A0ABQ9V6Y3_SAGOE|nr:Zinc finger FYVE domain-containing protein 1 [Saguinus oedipus]